MSFCLFFIFLATLGTGFAGKEDFTATVYNIFPLFICEAGSEITEEQVEDSVGLSYLMYIFEGANLTAGVDFTFMCLDGYPKDFEEKPYFYAMGREAYVTYQPYGVQLWRSSYRMVAMVRETSWEIFSGIDWRLFLLIFFVPFLLGLMTYGLIQGINPFYYVSNYLGYLFFSPEINFSVPVESYLVFLVIQTINLVFFSLYFWYLERVVDNTKTMGGLHKDENFYRQKIYVEGNLMGSFIDNPFIPLPIYRESSSQMYDPDFFIPLMEDGDNLPYYGMFFQIYNMVLYMCDLKMVHEFQESSTASSYYSVFSEYMPYKAERSISIAALEAQMYFHFLELENFDLYDEYNEGLMCSTRSYFDDFQLSYADMWTLWLILAFGLTLAVFLKLFAKISSYFWKQKGNYLHTGIRSLPNREVAKNVGNCFLIYSGISFMTMKHLYSPIILSKINRIRHECMLRLGETRLKNIRTNVLRQSSKLKFKSFVKTSLALLKKFSEANKKLNLVNAVKKLKKKLNTAGTNKHQNLKPFYSEILKDVLSKTLETLGIFKTPYPSRLTFKMSGEGYNISSVNSALSNSFFLLSLKQNLNLDVRGGKLLISREFYLHVVRGKVGSTGNFFVSTYQNHIKLIRTLSKNERNIKKIMRKKSFEKFFANFMEMVEKKVVVSKKLQKAIKRKEEKEKLRKEILKRKETLKRAQSRRKKAATNSADGTTALKVRALRTKSPKQF